MIEILKAFSPETAYVIEDYPYGFRLRCKKRMWVEYKEGKGCRMVSQTSNPKRGNVWNSAKSSTYSRFGLVLLLGDDGVVTSASCTEYSSCNESIAFRNEYSSGLCPDAQAVLEIWCRLKIKYEELKQKGLVTSTITTQKYDSDLHPLEDKTIETTVVKPDEDYLNNPVALA